MTDSSDAFQCQICILDYKTDNEDLTPIILKECGHTICFSCARGLLGQSNNSKIACPFCRKDQLVTNGDLKQLPKNFALLELLETQTRTSSQNPPSESSASGSEVICPCIEDSGHESTVFCPGCGADFCEKCFNMVHNSSRFLAEHRNVPISEKPIQLSKCQKHLYNTAEFMCRDPTCDVFPKTICHTCLLSDHKNHDYILLMDCLETYQELIRGNLEVVNRRVKNLEEKIRKVVESTISYDMESECYAEKIQEIIDFFDRQKAAAVENFDRFIDRSKDNLLKEQEQMEMDLSMLLEVKTQMDTVLKTKKNLESAEELVQRSEVVMASLAESSDSFATLEECEIYFPDGVEVFVSSV